MSGKNGMAKRRNRIYRRIAVALTVALLAGQSHAFVLAEEATDVALTEISDETATDASDNDNTGDNDSVTDQDDENNGDVEGKDTEEGNNPEEDEGTEDYQGDADQPEEILPEAVLGNALDEETDIAMSAEDGVEMYAVGEEFTYDGIKYVVTRDGEVEVGEQGVEAVRGEIVIPETFDENGVTYRVTSIGEAAFNGCYMLTSVEIPGSVTKIDRYAFMNCGNLTSVRILEGVISIGVKAFENCTSLTSVRIPESVTSIGSSAFYNCSSLTSVEIPESVTSIGVTVFYGCSSLTSVEIPKSVTSIGNGAFWECSSLTSVKISKNLTKIGELAFYKCEKLETLRIVVSSSNVEFQFPEVMRGAFDDLPNDIYILFVDESGKNLTGEAFDNAKAAFIEAGKSDDAPDDGKWYGWSLGEAPAEADKYAVTVHVQKDDAEWTGHGRSFALSANDGDFMETDLNAVAAGTYNVFDVTGGSKINTGIPIEVDGNDDTATVDYYTVTFCDEDGTEYGSDTAQKSQIVLKNAGRVVRPTPDPVKAGYTFQKWVTEDKNTEFSFASAPITGQTKLYAKWTENTAATYKVTINVMKDKQPWTDHGRSFALRKNGSDFITAQDQTPGSSYRIPQVPNGTYRIYDITDVPTDSLYSRAVDTGMDVRVAGADTEVDVTVQDADASEEIHYYTATFYDGDTAYGANTDQRPQVVLNGKQVVKPVEPEPSQPGVQFDKWVTQNGGSTEFNFNAPIRDTTSIYARWTDDTGVTRHRIDATAGAGGTIYPMGTIYVNEGANQTFEITPSDGYRIQSVTVDREDMTEAVKEAGNSYTFTDVRANHAINATFEADGSDPGGNGGDNSGDGDNNNSGGGDHSGGGGGNSGGGSDNGGNGDGDNSGGENGDGSDPGDGNATAGNSGNGIVSGGSTVSSQNSVSVDNSKSAGNGSGNTASGSKEPKTGDASQAEVYATIAMIAGLTYLLLYFMEEGRGMSEREKDAFVAAFVRWAKKGGAFRRCCAMVAIFCILAYYHSIGKRAGGNALHEKYLGQLS